MKDAGPAGASGSAGGLGRGPTRGHILSYALPQMAIAFATLGILNYSAQFYANELGLEMGLLSGLILLSRATDIVTDPLIGVLSDRTRSRWGRRKPWIIAGLPLFLVSIWLLWHPPADAGATWFFWSFFAVFLGLTCIQLPYVSWGAELSGDYDTRTRVAAAREGIGLVGSIGALAVTIGWALSGDATLGTTLRTMALLLVVLMPVMVLCALRVPAPPPVADADKLRFADGVAAIVRNKPFLVFLGGVGVAFIALVPGGAMNYFLFDHVYGRADLQGVSVLGEFIAAIAALPLWNALAQRIPKHRAMGLALVWIGGFTCLVPLAGDLFGVWGVMGMAAVRAAALGAVLSLPYSILADVIDIDTARTGRERTALYMSLGGVVVKFAVMVGLSVAFLLPGLAGFEADTYDNTPGALFAVEATFSYLPGVIWALALPIFWFFPLSPEEVAANRAQLVNRAAGFA